MINEDRVLIKDRVKEDRLPSADEDWDGSECTIGKEECER